MERTTRKPRSRGRETAAREPSNFIVQGSILALAGILVRLIGMFYRIPLANFIGDEGNGYYSAAYNIYAILLILSSYSLPVAVSKMVSARLAKGQYRNMVRILRASLFYATAAGAAGFAVLWFGADFFAGQVIRMPLSAYALRVLAPTIWIMAYLGVLRGFFQGHSTMVPTAASQIFEQVVNAVVSLLAAKSLFDLGTVSNLVYGAEGYSYAFGAAGGALGTGAGALTALLLFLFLMLKYRPSLRRQIRREKGGAVESYGTITGILFFTVVPIVVSSGVYNSVSVVDNILFGQVKTVLGEGQEIAAHWGVYSGKYHLLFNIPVAVANSLSSSLIPSLSRAVAERDPQTGARENRQRGAFFYDHCHSFCGGADGAGGAHLRPAVSGKRQCDADPDDDSWLFGGGGVFAVHRDQRGAAGHQPHAGAYPQRGGVSGVSYRDPVCDAAGVPYGHLRRSVRQHPVRAYGLRSQRQGYCQV